MSDHPQHCHHPQCGDLVVVAVLLLVEFVEIGIDILTVVANLIPMAVVVVVVMDILIKCHQWVNLMEVITRVVVVHRCTIHLTNQYIHKILVATLHKKQVQASLSHSSLDLKEEENFIITATPHIIKKKKGAWVLKPRNTEPRSIVHFVGGMFVGAAPQLTYRWFLECLSEKGILVIATPYASGFDHFLIADEVQFKFDRCLRALQEKVRNLPTYGIGHSLGSVIHLLIGSRYAVKRNGNVVMAFNNKEASAAVPLFSPVLVPVAQGIGPLLMQIASSPTIRLGAEMTMKQLENISPPIMKQVLPLVEQLPPLYVDLINGREDFSPKPEETKRIIRSYYGVSRNLLIKFKDDTIDETSKLAEVLSSESAISSMLDLSIRLLAGDHGLPLQQALPDVPPAMLNAGELLANLTAGTPLGTYVREVSNTFGVDSKIFRPDASREIEQLVNEIASWIASCQVP